MEDEVSKTILKIVNSADQPLETTEIIAKLGKVSRSMIVYRLNMLRGEGKIKGKSIGAGKGSWVWWKINAFSS
jgi:DNA-binding Lrp family transcriptional regulator